MRKTIALPFALGRLFPLIVAVFLLLPATTHALEFRQPDLGGLLSIGSDNDGDEVAAKEDNTAMAVDDAPTPVLPMRGSLSLEAAQSAKCESNVEGTDRVGDCCNQPVALLETMRAKNAEANENPFLDVYHCLDPSVEDSPIEFCSIQKRGANCASMITPRARAEVSRVYRERIPFQAGKAVFEVTPDASGPDVGREDIDSIKAWIAENQTALAYFVSIFNFSSKVETPLKIMEQLQVDRELGVQLPAMRKPYGMDFYAPERVLRCPKDGEEDVYSCKFPVHACILPAMQLLFAMETFLGEEGTLVSVQSCSNPAAVQRLLDLLVRDDAGDGKLKDSFKKFVQLYGVTFINLRESLDMMSQRNAFGLFGYDGANEGLYEIRLGKPDQAREDTEVISTLLFGDRNQDPDFEEGSLRAYFREGLVPADGEPLEVE